MAWDPTRLEIQERLPDYYAEMMKAAPEMGTERLFWYEAWVRCKDYLRCHARSGVHPSPCPVCGVHLTCHFQDHDGGTLHEEELRCVFCRFWDYDYGYGMTQETVMYYRCPERFGGHGGAVMGFGSEAEMKEFNRRERRHRKKRGKAIAEAQAMWNDQEVRGFLINDRDAKHHLDMTTHRMSLHDFLTEHRDGKWPIQTEALAERIAPNGSQG